MAKLKKVTDRQNHRLAISADSGEGELLLVRGGRSACLLISRACHGCCITVSGEKVLRKLATEILKELKTP